MTKERLKELWNSSAERQELIIEVILLGKVLGTVREKLALMTEGEGPDATVYREMSKDSMDYIDAMIGPPNS